MRCCSLKCITLVVPVFIAVIFYALYEPLPDDLNQKWEIQKVSAIRKFSNYMIYVGHMLGYGSRVNISRAIFNTFIAGEYQNENITLTDHVFSKVPVTIFRHKNAKAVSPAVIYIHGGGWVMSNTAGSAGAIADIVEWLNVIVVSIDYRHAPENPFPAGFDDCVAATVYVLRDGHKHGIDVNNVAITGDSAGGNLAAAVSQRLADENQIKLPKLKFQMLLYPVLQAFDLRLPSYIDLNNEWLNIQSISEVLMFYLGVPLSDGNAQCLRNNNHLTPALRKSAFRKFVDQNLLPERFRKTTPVSENEDCDPKFRKLIESKLINSYIFPLMATDVSGLPPTLLISAKYDVLRDEGYMYAERLRRAGVKYRHHLVNGVHGYFFGPPKEKFRFDAMIESLDVMASYAKTHFK